MDHRADVARRGDRVGAERPVDEVIVRDTGQLVESEGNLELADLDLRALPVAEVHVHVLPLRLRRVAYEQIPIAQLLFGELALDLIFDVPEEHALDSDAVAVQLEEARRYKT